MVNHQKRKLLALEMDANVLDLKRANIQGKKLKISCENQFEDVVQCFERLSSIPDHFIVPDDEKKNNFKSLTQKLYEIGQRSMDQFFESTKILPKNLPNGQQCLRPLKRLIVDRFDNEQVWQQLEVFNQPFMEFCSEQVASYASQRTRISLNVDFEEPKSVDSKFDSLSIKTNGILKKPNQDELRKNDGTKKVIFNIEEIDSREQSKERPENVDFFDISEMNQFLNNEDQKEMEKNSQTKMTSDETEEVDYFADIFSDSEDDDNEIDYSSGRNAMYKDFFDPPTSTFRINKNLNGDSFEGIENDHEESDDQDQDDGSIDTRDVDESFLNSSDHNDQVEFEDDATSSSDEDQSAKGHYDMVNEKLKALAGESTQDSTDRKFSEFELNQRQLKQKIAKAQQELLLPHNVKWQLSGETTADVRPENSLLEEHLKFDHVMKPAPIITDETTNSIESLIKQRIKDKVFDDVERKEKPNEQPFEFRRRIMLESEKSKVGLAEVYEQEFLKQQQKLKEQNSTFSGTFISEGEAEETAARKDIRRMMRVLFRKLDALSAFHYTPRPPEREVKIINNLPAITAEEIIPDSVSDMKLLAPEEVFNTRNKQVLQAPSERSETDKNRARRLKKKKQRIKQKFSQSSKQDSTSKQNSKDTANNKFSKENRKSFSSSRKFFTELQEKKEMAKTNKRNKLKQ